MTLITDSEIHDSADSLLVFMTVAMANCFSMLVLIGIGIRKTV